MHIQRSTATTILHELSASEHARLVRLCAQLSGDQHAAEDLAQETLLIAWRLRDRLRDPSRAQSWLWAIARNVCRHWRRRQRREGAHLLPAAATTPEADPAAQVADPFDLEVELERAELAELLDQALALLPAETRAVLVQRYIQQSPHAAIAAQLGLSENAVAVRLHRGKLAFRQILNTQLHAAAAPFGMVDPAVYRPTRIWCPICGAQRLVSSYDPQQGGLDLRCPACCPPGTASIWHDDSTDALQGAKQIGTALLRGMSAVYTAYRAAIARGGTLCQRCQRLIPLQLSLPADHPQTPYGSRRGLYQLCPTCGCGNSGSLRMFVQASPEVRAFWQRHPQMRTLPERELDVDGMPAVLISFQSVTDSAQIDVIVAEQTFAFIEVATRAA